MNGDARKFSDCAEGGSRAEATASDRHVARLVPDIASVPANDAGAVAADGSGKPTIHRLACYHC
jgi:hypothetical protein